MGLKDDVEKVEKKINETSIAMEMLQLAKKQNSQLEDHNKRLTWIIVLLILSLLATGGYLIYILNDIGVIETTEEVQEINDIDTIENSSIINGGTYGENSAKDKKD